MTLVHTLDNFHPKLSILWTICLWHHTDTGQIVWFSPLDTKSCSSSRPNARPSASSLHRMPVDSPTILMEHNDKPQGRPASGVPLEAHVGDSFSAINVSLRTIAHHFCGFFRSLAA